MATPRVILGTMTFGEGPGGRIASADEAAQIIALFKQHGHSEIDTARMYCDGATEHFLQATGATDASVPTALGHGLAIHTKAYPFKSGDFAPARLEAQLRESLAALGVPRVAVFYLHAPDHGTPIEATLAAVDRMHRSGLFGELGLSNYAAWQVMQIHAVCKANGYVLPTVYQGIYNPLTRIVEKELIPCLRALGIRFYAYNPLCGGLLSGHFKFEQSIEKGARFDPNTTQGARYRTRYWNDTFFSAVEIVKAAVANHEGLTLVSASYRWMFHHSKMLLSAGDGVVMGVSNLKHGQEILDGCEQGPLPDDVVAAFDNAFAETSGLQAAYFR
ncbi:Aflatoxin B1 aldehyde reductase member 2 [Entophlyctis luteolus]|nr:Aflatoxin B1 aldehyde reductase member 2 [Entophlyctis luteolus]